MSLTAASDEPATPGTSSAEEEELLRSDVGDGRARRAKAARLQAVSWGIGIAGVLGLAAIAAWHGVPAVRASLRGRSLPRAPVTVRSLLEGDELTDVATDNLMSFGKEALAPMGRAAVRIQVARRLQNISDSIRQEYPEAHEQMGVTQLSEAQKESALRVLRHYSDARVLSLTTEIADAVRETVQAKGDPDSLKRRLSERLGPRVEEMRQLAEDMFPGSGGHFQFDVDELPVVHAFQKWHPQLEVDLGAPVVAEAASARRLTAMDDVDGGVRAQAATLFQSLEHTLGPKMPTAPARMLSFFDTEDGSSAVAAAGAQPTGGSKHESFMSCVMAAIPNPMSVCSCIAANMKYVMSMLMSFVGGGKSR